MPVTVDAAGRTSFEIARIRPRDRSKRHRYDWRYRWQYGRRGSPPEAIPPFSLPYRGAQYPVIQGPGGTFSHAAGGRHENAIDWKMPEGTQICAARGGRVVAVKQDSREGGTEPKFRRGFANYVVVRHEDGSFAEYCHIRQGGARVAVGQEVKAGEPIALSGNTGFSSQPHLHFSVFYNLDGIERRTLPVSFKLPSGAVAQLKQEDVQ